MIFGLFRSRNRNAEIVGRLYVGLAEAARAPWLYRDLGIPDTVDGRFEALTVHAFLVLRRLAELPAPADDLAKDLIDTIFRHFDAALREMGVGDISVPKKMKTIASAFFGRSKAYEEAWGGEASLEQALARNIYGGSPPAGGEVALLSAYLRESAARLSGLGFDDFVAARLPFRDAGPGGVCRP